MLIDFATQVRRSTMHQRLADAMHGDFVLGEESPTNFLRAIEATGYWIKWRMPARQLESLGTSLLLRSRAEELAQSANIVRAAVERASNSLREWVAEASWLGNRRPQSMAVASDALRERMRADAVLEGIEWMCEQMLFLDSPKKLSATLCDMPSELQSAVDGLSETIHDLDTSLQRCRWEISGLAQTSLLSSMRSAIPDRQWLPWWLSGTLELISLVRLTPQAERLHEVWKARESTMRSIEYRTYTEMLESAVVTSLDGRGVPVNEPTSTIESKEGTFWAYDWMYKSDGDKCRVRLIAPTASWDPAKRRPALKLQFGDAYATQPTPRPDVLSQKAWHLRNLEDVLVGRMMFVNGLMFRWIDSGESRPLCATLHTRRSPPLPESGQMIMADCQTGVVLQPLTNR